MKRFDGTEVQIKADEPTMETALKKYPSLAKADPQEVLDCMSEMMNVGTQVAYIIGYNDAWIMPDIMQPGLDEPVDVTVLMPDGIRRTATAKYRGRWIGAAAKAGTIIAWRPKPVPYDPEMYTLAE